MRTPRAVLSVRHRRSASVVLAAGALLLAGCGGDEDASTGTPTADDGGGETDDDVVEPADEDAATDDGEEHGVEAASEDDDTGDAASEQQFPDVVGVEASQGSDGTWSFDVTLSSPYDTPERYADAWRVLGPDGSELGVRELAHDHADEQPFTRSLDGVEVPEDVDEVTVEGRDQANGWGGETVTYTLPR